ncbi:MAG: type II secretion system GspH family protein [Candidatus Pacebacteria bacterium]|nr:type II secretion system GspH family protein [Candidatus Paceibacterota bacterium]
METSKNLQSGFTLIEMIVSLAIFTTVIGISVGALLVLVGTNEQLQKEQSVMTNLSFALDSMTRELRTGVHYFCETRPNTIAGGVNNIFNNLNDLDSIPILNNSAVDDCSTGRQGGQDLHGIAFSEGGDSISGSSGSRILYYHNASDGKIYRRVGGEPAQSIVSSGIYITDVDFFVTGSKPLSTGGVLSEEQATITIFIEAKDINDMSAKPYRIQTTVTQRTLDI